jgi:cytochrome c2
MTTKELILPFRPRARLLQILGDQLIGSPRLAVVEHVKNAYDADADTVTVTLEHIDTPDRRIIVQDDGLGMTLKTIKDIWLVPAHDHRAAQRALMQRTTKQRLPLGEKGVGRFAVHKLGDRIELVTRAEGKKECVVTIDWDTQIDKPFLSDTAVLIQMRAPEVFTGYATGTKLTISRLRDDEIWSRGEVRRLRRQITSISSPFLKIDPHETGMFLGQCAQYCGTQHAKMLLRVYVQPRAEFERWVHEQQQPAHASAPSAAASNGQRVFESTACVNCHAVSGTPAKRQFGPDLTHLMSRETIAAGAAPNTPEMLRLWIKNPDAIKPGSKMPAMGLSEQDVDAVATYLETLR